MDLLEEVRSMIPDSDPVIRSAPIYNISLSGSFMPILDEVTKDYAFQLIDNRFMHKKSALLFHTPSCPHCRTLMSRLYEFAKKTKGHMAPVGLINVMDAKHNGADLLSTFYKVSGFPTLAVHFRGKYKLYSGSDMDIDRLLDDLQAEMVGADHTTVVM